jgi:hypothetical protein
MVLLDFEKTGQAVIAVLMQVQNDQIKRIFP